MNLALKTNCELTNENASPRKFIPDVKSNVFTRKQTKAIKSINTNCYFIDKFNKFDFTDSKKEETSHEYHQWGAYKKIMDIINKRMKRPETLRLKDNDSR